MPQCRVPQCGAEVLGADVLLRDHTFRRLCLARDILREESEIPRSIEDIARQVEISPPHFTRQFEAKFGLTPQPVSDSLAPRAGQGHCWPPGSTR